MITITLIIIILPTFLIIIIPSLLGFGYITTYYVVTAREIKRIESNTKAPLVSHF